LPVPVVLVGAQRSSDRGSSDAYQNLTAAAVFITATDCASVCICMHESMDDDACIILPGTRSRKMHTSQRNAFRPINAKPYARVRTNERRIEVIDDRYRRRDKEAHLQLRPIREDVKVGLLKVHTNMFAEQFLAYKDFDGLVLEGTALGQLPNVSFDEHTKEHERIEKALSTLAQRMPVVMASQCIYGRIDMNVYSEGRKNIKLGIMGNYHDMTPETTFIKLAWLLSNVKSEEVKMLITTNLRGEIEERLDYDTFLW